MLKNSTRFSHSFHIKSDSTKSKRDSSMMFGRSKKSTKKSAKESTKKSTKETTKKSTIRSNKNKEEIKEIRKYQ